MSEAFEIGVTLALNDGVSAGIERTRREMAQLQEVLKGSGLPVERLRAAAAGATAPREVKDEASKARPVSAGESVWVADEREPAVVTGKSQQPMQVAPEKPVTSTHERPWEQRLVPQQVPQEARGVASGMATAEPLGVRGPSEMTASPRGDVGAPPPAAVAQNQSVVTNVAAVRDEEPAVAAAPLPERAVTLNYAAAAPVSHDALVPSVTMAPQKPVWRDDGRAAAPGRGEGLYDPPRDEAVAPVPGSAVAPQTVPDVTNVRTASGASAAVSRGGMPAAPPKTGEAPETRGREAGGQIEGDVYLDGMLVGRWISRFLKQEASRAPVGPTGFDVRRDRILPGPTVGM